MADLTMVPSEKSVSESETEPAVRRIKAGYTYINKRAGFVYETYSNDVLQMSLSGGGNYNSKSVTLNALGDGYIKAASPLGGDVELKFKMSLQDLQMIRSDGTYFSGIIELEPEGDLLDKIQIDLRGSNGVQEIKTLLGTKNGGRGNFDLVAEKQ